MTRKRYEPRTREELLAFLGEEPPSREAIAFADSCLARATFQPGQDAIESARLAIAFQFDEERARDSQRQSPAEDEP